MEVTKEIFIEGNLKEKSVIKFYYKGKFTREYSNEVYIVFGYGLGWKNIKEQKMIWMNDCFFAEIKLEESGILNFCFRNDFNAWDNNNGQDYAINIEESEFYINGRIFNEINVEQENIYIKQENVKLEELQVNKELKKQEENMIEQYEKNFEKSVFEHDKKIPEEIITSQDDKIDLEAFNKKIENNDNFKIDTNHGNAKIYKNNRSIKTDKSKSNNKRYKKNGLRNIIRIVSLCVLVIGIIYVIIYFFEKKDMEKQTKGLLNSVDINKNDLIEDETISFEVTERMLQVRELNAQYPDLKGWIEIEGTNINYPLMQGIDNDFYVKHDYKKEYSKWGSLFLDKAYDWTIPSSNMLIYGHNFSDGVMLSDLLKYSDKTFYEAHPIIKVTTSEEDSEYEIIAVFYSRLYYKSEKNVFRYYFFVNAENELEYNEFVNNAKKASIYDTGKTAVYGDQLLTLSTCEYSQEDGRFAIVARKIK